MIPHKNEPNSCSFCSWFLNKLVLKELQYAYSTKYTRLLHSIPRFLIQLTKEPQHKPSSPRTLLTISFSSSPTLTGFVTRCSTSPYHCWLHSLSLSTPVRFQVSPASRPSTSSSGTSPFQNHQNLRWICGLGVLGLWFVIWGFLICDLGFLIYEFLIWDFVLWFVI